jgi:hypothetical protein
LADRYFEGKLPNHVVFGDSSGLFSGSGTFLKESDELKLSGMEVDCTEPCAAT